jgi:hypothetical protein
VESRWAITRMVRPAMMRSSASVTTCTLIQV